MRLSRRGVIAGAAASILVPANTLAYRKGALVCPPLAQAAGFTSNKYYCPFSNGAFELNRVDLNDTQQAGFDWYMNHTWPNTAGPFACPPRENWRSFPHQLGSNISFVQNQGLFSQQNPDTSGKINIISACASANAQGYVGNVFGPGFYTKFVAAWFVQPTGAEFAYVGFPIEFFIGQAAQFVELDFLETQGEPNAHCVQIEWDLNNPACPGPSHEGGCIARYNQFHTIEFVWKTIAQGGGTGSITYYVDGSLVFTQNYPEPTQPILELMDTHHYVLYTNTPGSNGANAIKSIEVWGPP